MKNCNTTMTIGMDLGSRKHDICILDGDGKVVVEEQVESSVEAVLEYFSHIVDRGSVTVAMEAGTHSRWVSEMLSGMGFSVLVGNPRKLRMIWDSDNKNDRRDAEMLARIARMDPRLLSPIRHRGCQAHMDLALVKARDALVSSRTMLINTVRGMCRSAGTKLPSCSADSFAKSASSEVPEGLRPALVPLLETMAGLTLKIKEYDRKIVRLCQAMYPETERLQKIAGVGALTALAFVLVLEDPKRFRKSREVGPYLGLVPRRDQSGDTDKQLRITKTGNGFLRRLLVGAAHYILGPFAPPSDLREYGERIAARGGKTARKKAVVAVARKLAVLMHALWARPDNDYVPQKRRRTRVA